MTNNLFYTKEELRLHARDLRMKNLLDKGTVTSREILIADFGTENIKGLDIKSYPELTTRAFSMTESLSYQMASPEKQKELLNNTAGLGGNGDLIYVHPDYLDEKTEPNRDLSNIISHEHVHRMQGYERDSGWSSTMRDTTMNAVRAPVSIRTIWEAKTGNNKTLKINNPADWLRRKYQTETQNRVEKRALKRENDYSARDYFSTEREMQARLHEVMAQGYNCWGKMPVNKTELYAAMTHLGFSMPEKIKHRLADTEQGRQALRDFYLSDRQKEEMNVRDEIEELNYVKKFAALPEKQAMLFENVYPALYGNLLEMYGDGPGRARMGLGVNPRPAKDLMYAFHNTPGVLQDEQRFNELVNAIPAEHANEVINRLIDGSVNNLHGRIRTQALSNKIIGGLLEREDVIKLLNKTSTVDNSTPERFAMTIPCICAAVRAGRTDVINTLMDKGYNPLNEITAAPPFPTQPGQTYPALTGMINIYGRREQSLNDPSLTDDMREELTTFINDIEKGLQAIANHPASSTYRNLSDDFNNKAGHTSAREVLAGVGIYTQTDTLEIQSKHDETVKDGIGHSEKPNTVIMTPPPS